MDSSTLFVQNFQTFGPTNASRSCRAYVEFGEERAVHFSPLPIGTQAGGGLAVLAVPHSGQQKSRHTPVTELNFNVIHGTGATHRNADALPARATSIIIHLLTRASSWRVTSPPFLCAAGRAARGLAIHSPTHYLRTGVVARFLKGTRYAPSWAEVRDRACCDDGPTGRAPPHSNSVARRIEFAGREDCRGALRRIRRVNTMSCRTLSIQDDRRLGVALWG